MNFIKATFRNATRPVYLNADSIQYLRQDSHSTAVIVNNGNTLEVMEKAEDLLAQLEPKEFAAQLSTEQHGFITKLRSFF